MWLMFLALVFANQPLPDNDGTNLSPRGDCYDAAVVARVLRVRDWLDLNETMPRQPDQIYLGGTMHALIRSDAVLAGISPKLQWVTVTLTTVPTPRAELLLLIRRKESTPVVTHVEVLQLRSGPREWKQTFELASRSHQLCN